MRGPLHKLLKRLWPSAADHVSWWPRVGVLLFLVSLQLAQDGYQFASYRGWPAVAYVEVSSPSGLPTQVFHSPWSYAINVVAALAVIGATWLLDRILRLRQFTLREMLGVMLCIGLFLACVRMGRTHSANFLSDCGLHQAAGLMRRDWDVRFRS